jgi:hypothetical protein
MASSSLDAHRASSDAPECIEQVFTMEYHYDKLLRPRSLIRYYEELSRLSRSNDPEEQLLQKIRDGASIEVLESHLNLTFQNISDRIDVEINRELASASLDTQGNERDKRGALARGWVYHKALGEAKDDTPIKEFFVRKLRTDDCLQKGGHCAMVDCSAVRWNMVNIVLASIRWKDAAQCGEVLRNEELLAIAVEYGHVRLVQHLTKMQDVDVNISLNLKWDFSICQEDFEANNTRLSYQENKFTNSHFVFLQPIDSAARMGNVEMVMNLLACDRIDVNEGEPFHWAAAMGHPDVVKELLKSKVDVNALNLFPVTNEHNTKPYGLHFSPLHLASLCGHTSVVKALCEDTKGRLKANTENPSGITALQIATEMKHDEIVKTLPERPEVANQMEGLYRDRQVHVDAANAILVGAALIASVTSPGWLQPPLGNSEFFGNTSLEIFWFFNSMSFFFAIATLMVGASAARPPKRNIFIGEVVRSLRASLSLAYILLTISVGCVMGAFASAGFLVLPPIPEFTTNMEVTVVIGVTVVFLAWTSSKVPVFLAWTLSEVLYVLKVMKMNVKKIIY